MSNEDQDLETETEGGDVPARKLTLKERAKAFRKEAYQKAKVRVKAQREAYKESDAGKAQAQKLKDVRRSAYLKSKEAHKARQGESDNQAEAAAKAERAAATAAKTEDLLKQLVPADTLAPKPKSHLRLVKN